MWHIISDNETPVSYIVVHETIGRTDRVLRTYNGDCWVSDLIYDKVEGDDQPESLEHFLIHNDFYAIHSFESDDPLTYLQNLSSIHPEFFI